MAGGTINSEVIHRTVKLIKFTFVGNVTSTETGRTTSYYDGKLLHVITSPNTAKVPTANWDLTIKDSNGIDLLAGAGLNRSSGTTQHKLSSTMGAIAGSRLRFIVANTGGTTGGGSVYVYIR